MIHRKASNTVDDIKEGRAGHILERKAKNSVEDVKEFAGNMGEKLQPAVDKVTETAKGAYDAAKPTIDKATHAVADGANKVVDKVKDIAK